MNAVDGAEIQLAVTLDLCLVDLNVSLDIDIDVDADIGNVGHLHRTGLIIGGSLMLGGKLGVYIGIDASVLHVMLELDVLSEV